MKNKNNYLVLILMLMAAATAAQEYSISPYSVFGIGDINFSETGRNGGMAGAGIGLSGRQMLNTSNPATFAALDSTTFLLDLAASARGSIFSSGSNSQKAFTGNFSKLTVGMHLTPFWSAGISVQPYSSVSYKVEKENYIEGSQSKVITSFEGSGGVTRFSFINSLRISENFSFGADLMVLHGNITKFSGQNYITVKQTSTATNLFFSLGMLYSEEISPGLKFGAGATYFHGGSLHFDNETSVTDESGIILYSKPNSASAFTIPRSYGAGISLESKRVTVAADYRYQKWSLSHVQNYNLSYTDTHIFNMGISFTPARAYPKNYMELVRYQTGISISNSYFTIDNVNPICFEATAGVSFPFRDGTEVSTVLGWGKRGSLNEGMIREDYLRFSLCVSFAERWFLKRMYE